MATGSASRSARAAQQVATTAMPFLYQTKTICNNTTPLRRAALQQLLRSRPSSRHCLHQSSRRRQNDDSDRYPREAREPSQAPSEKEHRQFKEYPETPAPPNSPALSAVDGNDSSEPRARAPSYHNSSMRSSSDAQKPRGARQTSPRGGGGLIRKVNVALPRDSEPQDGTGGFRINKVVGNRKINVAEPRDSEDGRFKISKFTVDGGEGKYRRLEKKAAKSLEPEDVPWESSGGANITKKTPLAVVDDSFGYSGQNGEHEYNPFDSDNLFAEDEGEIDFSIPAATAPGESTITLEERHTFEAIFEDIYKRTQAGTMNASGKAQARELQAKKIDPSAAKQKLASILNDGKPAQEAEEQSHGSMADLKSYPQALRAVAAQALGLIKKPGATGKVPKVAKKVITAQDEARTKERARIENLLVNAPSDIALWAVMEKEVFSLIPRLGLGVEAEKGKDGPSIRDRRTRKGKLLAAEAAADAAKEAEARTSPAPSSMPDVGLVEPPKKLEMAIYGPLYPSLLLRSLQLLNSGFQKSSPLTLNVLPRIKSLGLASHILGASTPFYNELMRVYYYTYSDFKGVAKLLLEMLNSGQEMDQDTHKVVMEIVRMQARLGKARMLAEATARGMEPPLGAGVGDKAAMSEGLRRLYEMPMFLGRGKVGKGRGREGVFLGWERAIKRDLEESEQKNLDSTY